MFYKTLAIEENIPLGGFTTFRVGGLARYFTRVCNESDLQNAILFSREHSLPVFILGGGSNIVISDEGFSGLVIVNKINGVEIWRDGNNVWVRAGAGESWDNVVQTCVEKKLAGIECLSGIPGTVGGAVVQNIGAYGQSIHEVVEEVRTVNIETGEVARFSNADCLFRYRDSLFKSSNAGKFIVSGASFRFVPNGAPNLNHHDLKNYFSERVAMPLLEDVRKTIIDIRGKKGFVLLPGYPNYQSAGSFFKNLVVSRATFHNIQEKIFAEKKHDGCKDPWFWFMPSEEVKISAACLIERTGFSAGYRAGNVGLSPHHPLAIINFGQASSGEIINLARDIQKKVQETFGVLLEPEVLFVGFSAYPLLR